MEAQQVKPVTFDDLVALDKQLKSVNLASFDNKGAAEDITSQLKQICNIYKVIKPVLNVILGLPFIPGKDVIKKFTSILDSICG